MDNSVLKNNKNDYIEKALKSYVGVIPGVGTLIGEIISVCIPNQRLDRVCVFLEKLHDKVVELESKIKEEYVINIIEDTLPVIARNRSTLKNKGILELVKNAINKEIKTNLFENILPVLSDLSDEQIIILLFLYNKNSEETHKLLVKYREIVAPETLRGSIETEKYVELLDNYKFNRNALFRNKLVDFEEINQPDFALDSLDLRAVESLIREMVNHLTESINDDNRNIYLTNIGKVLASNITSY